SRGFLTVVARSGEEDGGGLTRRFSRCRRRMDSVTWGVSWNLVEFLEMSPQLYLTPADQGMPLTLDELERAGGLEGYRYELIDGKLEVSPLPELPHDCLARWLIRKLGRYSERHPQVINDLPGPAPAIV